MPRQGSSGVKGLIKRHHGCQVTKPTDCDCQWSGKYKGHEVVLSKWADCTIDPHTKTKAKAVLTRMKKEVDDGNFDPEGEHPTVGSEQTLKLFIPEWKTHYAEERRLTSNSLDDALNVIATSRLGRMTLKQLATATEVIERWLNKEGQRRRWKAVTWNDYRSLLNRLCKRAVKWKRLTTNPITAIERKVQFQPDHFKRRHLEEDVEDRLFTAVEKLSHARAHHKGAEMRRRLIGAFDGGLRRGEMLHLQLHHVNWKPMLIELPDGTRVEAYEIELPPEITKGGKTTGETESVYAATV